MLGERQSVWPGSGGRQCLGDGAISGLLVCRATDYPSMMTQREICRHKPR